MRLERNVAGRFSKKWDKVVATAAMRAALAECDPKLVWAAYCNATECIAAGSGELLEGAEADVLAYLDFSYEHHIRLRTKNVQERANEETRRRIRVVGVFPSDESTMRLVGTVLIDANEEWLGTSFIDAASLKDVRRS